MPFMPGPTMKARPSVVELTERLGELVSLESPPGSIPELEACADLPGGWGERVVGPAARRGAGVGGGGGGPGAVVRREGLPHLLWWAPEQDVLLLGHFDTVWPSG